MPESRQSTIKEIAELLRLRNSNSHPTVLLLGSQAGALFRSDHFFKSLCGFSQRDLSLSSHTAQFSEYDTILTNNQFSETEIHSLFRKSLENLVATKADVCLAELVRQEYFDEIISTNIDDLLEQSFAQIGMREPWDYEVIHPYHNLTRERNAPFRVIKVFGDFTSRDYTIHRRINRWAKEQEPALSLQHILEKDILVVGIDPKWDRHILNTISGTSGTLWFVGEEEDLIKQETISDLLRQRPSKYIVGRDGRFDDFMTSLHSYLSTGMPLNYQANTTPPPTEPSATTTASPAQTTQQISADVLIITVTEIETRTVLAEFKVVSGKAFERHSIGDKIYYDLGIINGAKIFLVESEMGTATPGGSLLTVIQGIEALKPSAVMMVGIAFGFDATKQHIGDVLISQQLLGYELQRYGQESDGTPKLIPRGDRVSASSHLINTFRSGLQDWAGPARIVFGLILSGEKLVDNEKFRDQLHTLEPEAVGGEMEGAGLYIAAQHHKTDWILVKGICDLADGNKAEGKSQNQEVAAKNATLYILHILQKIRFG
jgi:nucleoside phosphorylase